MPERKLLDKWAPGRRHYWKSATEQRGEAFLRSVGPEMPAVTEVAVKTPPSTANDSKEAATEQTRQQATDSAALHQPIHGQNHRLHEAGSSSIAHRKPTPHEHREMEFLSSLATVEKDPHPSAVHLASLSMNARIFFSNYHRSGWNDPAALATKNSAVGVPQTSQEPSLISNAMLLAAVPEKGGHVRLQIVRSKLASGHEAASGKGTVLAVSSVIFNLTEVTSHQPDLLDAPEVDVFEGDDSEGQYEDFGPKRQWRLLAQKYQRTKAAVEAKLRKRGLFIKHAAPRENFFGQLLRPSCTEEDLAPLDQIGRRQRKRRLRKGKERTGSVATDTDEERETDSPGPEGESSDSVSDESDSNESLEADKDAYFLDDPTIKGELRRRLITLPGYTCSFIPFSEVRNLEQDVNERFWLTHPYLQRLNVQLTHIRKIKFELMELALEERSIIDLSTAIYAICYFERLVLKLKVNEHNRHLAAAVCVLLSVKFWEGGISSAEVMRKKIDYTLDKVYELWGVTRGKIFALEFKCFTALDFGLLVPTRFALTHFVRQLGTRNLTPSEFLAKVEVLSL